MNNIELVRQLISEGKSNDEISEILDSIRDGDLEAKEDDRNNCGWSQADQEYMEAGSDSALFNDAGEWMPG